MDLHAQQIHVTRGLLAHVWEGYDAGGGAIESRETMRWPGELVGTITLAEFADSANLHDELICLIWQAIVGTSRLPLTSVEAPLPGFAFGQLHYVYCADAGETPSDSWEQLLVLSLQPDRLAGAAQDFRVRSPGYCAGRIASLRRIVLASSPTWLGDR